MMIGETGLCSGSEKGFFWALSCRAMVLTDRPWLKAAPDELGAGAEGMVLPRGEKMGPMGKEHCLLC